MALTLNGIAQGLAADRLAEVARVLKVDRDWLIRTAAAYAPQAVVTSPPDIVAAIVAVLEEAAS